MTEGTTNDTPEPGFWARIWARGPSAARRVRLRRAGFFALPLIAEPV